MNALQSTDHMQPSVVDELELTRMKAEGEPVVLPTGLATRSLHSVAVPVEDWVRYARAYLCVNGTSPKPDDWTPRLLGPQSPERRANFGPLYSSEATDTDPLMLELAQAEAWLQCVVSDTAVGNKVRRDHLPPQ